MTVSTASGTAANLFAQANAAFVEDDIRTALDLYNQAIALAPTDADFHLKRAIAFHRLQSYQEASADISTALKLAQQQNLPLSYQVKVLLRRGMTEMALKRFGEAIKSFQGALILGADDAEGVKRLIAECEANVAATTTNAVPSLAAFAAPSKIRHEWFQNDEYVMVSVFVKQRTADDVAIQLGERTASITIKLPTGSDYSLELDPLAHEIVPSQSEHFVRSTKIEVKLKKKSIGLKWGALEGDDALVTAMASGEAKPPAYPSSSKKRVDWGQVEKTVDEEKPQGEQALNSLFQQIFRDGTDETRRAMMKSFVESGGTCLSTNWDEVGKGKVDARPPDGMEAKKWCAQVVIMSL